MSFQNPSSAFAEADLSGWWVRNQQINQGRIRDLNPWVCWTWVFSVWWNYSQQHTVYNNDVYLSKHTLRFTINISPFLDLHNSERKTCGLLEFFFWFCWGKNPSHCFTLDMSGAGLALQPLRRAVACMTSMGESWGKCKWWIWDEDWKLKGFEDKILIWIGFLFKMSIANTNVHEIYISLQYYFVQNRFRLT